MAGIRRIHSGQLTDKVAFSIEYVDEKVASVDRTALVSPTLSTDAQLVEEVTRQLKEVPTVPVFLHKNRSGTIAVATGAEPEVWPEDEVDPDARLVTR